MKLIKQKLGKVSITVEKDYWSDQRSYDRLVIVEVANVGCFLSRKFVPVGIQYTDREYWIKFGYNTGGGGGGSDIEVVTDFGDSIVKVICQKTITDKVTEIENNFGNYYTKQIQDQSTDGIYNRIDQVEETLGYDIRTNKRNIENLQQFQNVTEFNLTRLTTTTNTHTSQIDTLKNDVTRLNSADEHMYEVVNELTTTVEDVKNRVTNAYVTPNTIRKNILYIGGQITKNSTSKGLIVNFMIERLGKIKNSNFFTLEYPNLTYGDLEDIMDGNYEIDSNFPGFNQMGTVIIQVDTTPETVGTDSDYPATLNDLATYGDSVYGKYTKFVDWLHTQNIDVTVLFVAAPNTDYDDNYAGQKPYAIKKIAEVTKSLYVNPFKFRYSANITTTIEVDGISKTVLFCTSSQYTLYTLILLANWGRTVADHWLLNMHSTQAK